MFINHFLIRIMVIMIAITLSGSAQSTSVNCSSEENGKNITETVEAEIKIDTTDETIYVNDFSVYEETAKDSVINAGALTIDDNPTQPTMTGQSDIKKHAELSNDNSNSQKDESSATNNSSNSGRPTAPVTGDKEVSDKNDNTQIQTESANSNAPYEGDAAVPPDVDKQTTNVATNKPAEKCEEHDLLLVETKINNSYELYNYVTDYYKCSNCNHTTTDVHIASSNVTSATIASAENEIIKQVNKLRVANGLNELWTDGNWSTWANTRAAELESFYGHRRPNGGDWLYAIGNNYTIGENIASGQASGYDFYNAFYNSAQHKDLMLAEEAVGIAVGLYVNEDGSTYCAMIAISEY